MRAGCQSAPPIDSATLQQAERRHLPFFDTERQFVRHNAIEIGTGYGKRRGIHPGGGEAHLDLAARFRFAAPGIRNPVLDQDRRDPLFPSYRRCQQEGLRCGAVDGGCDDCLYAACLPWRAIYPGRPRPRAASA
jgi:hypothetical protein